MALIIKNGLVFLGEKFEKKEILINDAGIIEKIGFNLTGEETFDAKGMIISPGLIDPHVHLREPGQKYKEDFTSGSKAAIAGGITTLMDMPNNKLPTTTKERLLEKTQRAKKAPASILFHFGATDDNFEEVKKANPNSMKIYLGKTTGELKLKNPKSMERHFLNFDKNKPIVLHACDDSGNDKHDLDCLENNVKEAVSLANKMNRRIHLAHVSTKKEITTIRNCKSATSEVAPHHLFLSKKDEEKLKFFAKVNPPLRSDQERIGLWSSLEFIDCIATDHAPHSVEDKEEGAAGFPGLETSLSLMLEGANRGLVDKIWIFKAMSENVANAFNLNDRGKIEVGRIGDISIIDLKKEWIVDSSKMQSKCKWSPFDGWKLKGKCDTVIRKGELIYQEEKFVK